MLTLNRLSITQFSQGCFSMILIIDFGSQYNQLIARRVRENRVYCQIEPPDISVNEIRALIPEGIILSGGPSSIYAPNSPKADPAIFDLGVPVLGICYGHAVHGPCPGRAGGKSRQTGVRICRTEYQHRRRRDFCRCRRNNAPAG